MSVKRMFDTKIIQSNEFLHLTPTQQILYIQLNMSADDDGVINNSKAVLNLSNAEQNDLMELINERFVLALDNLLIIKHFFINNIYRVNRNETLYKEKIEKNIYLDKNYIYREINKKNKENNINLFDYIDLIKEKENKEKEKSDDLDDIINRNLKKFNERKAQQ